MIKKSSGLGITSHHGVEGDIARARSVHLGMGTHLVPTRITNDDLKQLDLVIL